VRRFLLLAHRVPPDGAFSLNDLAGSGGRMDEVARVASNAFTLSNDLRRDTELLILFSLDPARGREISLSGARLKFLNPDERSTAALLKNALARATPSDRPTEVSPGLSVGPVDPLARLAEFARRPDAVWLTESGGPIEGWPSPEGGFAAVLSDPSDPTPAEVAVLEAAGLPRVRVGPRSLRSSQVVDLVHHEFDRREEPSRPPPGGPA